MIKQEKLLFKIWNTLLIPSFLLRLILGILADFWLFVGKFLGDTYTKLFGLVGTSWYDHRFDYLRGAGNFYWLERAFFALDRIFPTSYVLDLGCGDGTFSGLFYGSKAKKVLAIDNDARAIKHAKRYYRRKNVKFVKIDINKYNFPENEFDQVFMFAVIEHFKPADGMKILDGINRSLRPNGMFFGSTPIFANTKFKANYEHENEFDSVESLNKFLKKAFSQVRVFQTNWPGRNECYFECKKSI